ncbi:MAG: rhodanese-like domain-containing protein [Bdellovibrionota bacterium]
MTPKEAHDLVKQGKALLIDVREEDELQSSGTAQDALWMPLSAMVEDTDEWRAFKQSLPRDKQLILFCKLGGRSGRMAEFLSLEGFQTFNLGGFSDWTKAGLPVEAFPKK